MAARASPAAWRRALNLLCVRLDGIGDVLMTSPAIRALKESAPGRRVTLLASQAGAQLAPLLPFVDAVMVYEAPWMKATAPRADSGPDHRAVQALREGRFDGAVIFTTYSQSPLPAALLCYLADVPVRLAHCRENPYQLLTHWLPEREPERLLRHEVQRQLDLVAAIGARTEDERLRIGLPEEAAQRALRLLGEVGLDAGRPWAVVHPGGTASSRRYPPESYAAVGRALAGGCGWQLLFTGAAEEAALVEEVRATISGPTFTLAGQLDLATLAAVLALAPVVITNNTAPAHLAAAVGTPVVVLYALTNPQHVPWGVPSRVLFHDVPCKFCYSSVCPEGHHRCLRLVPPEAVAQAALELVQERADGLPSQGGGAEPMAI